MEALAKEQLSSDSEDEDYVPPEVKEPTLSLRKRSGGLELESDDQDDDDELSDDADLVDAEVAQSYGSQGAGPSSAGAGPSSAAAVPSGAGAASSSAAAGSSATAGPSNAAGASTVGTGLSSADAGASSAVVRASGLPAEASSIPGATTAGASSGTGEGPEVASGVVDGVVATEKEKSAEAGPGAEANVGKSEAEAGVPGANGAPSAKVEEPVAKKPRVEKPAGKQSIDDIWADMNVGVTPSKKPTAATDAGLAAWLTPSPTEKKEFKITRLTDLEQAVKREEPVQKKKGRTGLEGVLDVVRGKTDTVIKKTKEQWKEFKKDDEINEELEKYKKDKNRYTDKVAFLQRSDVREWEHEQKGKRRR